ncbi:MAG: tyrosine-type recombinase/integrase, partial [Oscillospiraceae bacterium]|nr:tyrosine-type recombinase/integrase [Oscillospiraceae bacterium]
MNRKKSDGQHRPSNFCFLDWNYITQITESYNKAEMENADKENRLPLLLPHLSPHILRHSFASRAVESNAIPPKHLQTMLGHSSIQV